MADALEVANKRRQDYKEAISKKEAEIAELRELITELNEFIEFGDALVASGPVDSASVESAPVETAAAAEPDAISPATPKDENVRVAVKSRNPMSAEHNKQNLARVMSQRTS